MVIVKTHDELNQITEENEIVLVDFWASWRSPCLLQLTTLAEMQDEDFTIVKVCVEDGFMLADAYKVISIPTILIFKDGELVIRESGVKNKEQILNLIQEAKDT